MATKKTHAKAAKVKPGDVLSVEDSKTMKEYQIVVIYVESDHGFYYTKLPLGSYRLKIAHSNMLLGDTYEKVSQMDLEHKSAKGFDWYLTGEEDIDIEMSHHDGRIELFNKFAAPSLKRRFDKNEDINAHRENALTVNEFANYLLDGGKPEQFYPSNASFSEKVQAKYLAQAEEEEAEAHHNSKRLTMEESIDSFMFWAMKYADQTVLASEVKNYIEKQSLGSDYVKKFSLRLLRLQRYLESEFVRKEDLISK